MMQTWESFKKQTKEFIIKAQSGSTPISLPAPVPVRTTACKKQDPIILIDRTYNKLEIGDIEWQIIYDFIKIKKPGFGKMRRLELLKFIKEHEGKYTNIDIYHSFYVIPDPKKSGEQIILATSRFKKYKNMNEYVTEDVVGTGEYSRIKLAQTKGGILYACKVSQNLSNPQELEIEIKRGALGGLDRMSETGKKKRIIFQELHAGVDLGFINQNIHFDMWQLHSLSYSIAKAVKNMHDDQIAHGDIHEGNIIIKTFSAGLRLPFIFDYGKASINDQQLMQNDIAQLGRLFKKMGVKFTLLDVHQWWKWDTNLNEIMSSLFAAEIKNLQEDLKKISSLQYETNIDTDLPFHSISIKLNILIESISAIIKELSDPQDKEGLLVATDRILLLFKDHLEQDESAFNLRIFIKLPVELKIVGLELLKIPNTTQVLTKYSSASVEEFYKMISEYQPLKLARPALR